MKSKMFGAALVVALCLAVPAMVWAQSAPTDLQLAFEGPKGGRGSIVTMSVTVDPVTLTSPGKNRFEVVKNSAKADLSTAVSAAFRELRDTQAVFGLTELPPLTGGDYYIARVSSSVDGINFPATTVIYSTQQIPWVEQGRHAPVAIAGDDQAATLGSLVTLSGAQSFDPNGDGLSYQWTKISGVTVVLPDPTAVIVTFTPPATGKYTFRLRVSDDDSQEEDGPDAEYGEDTVSVTVGVWPVDAGPDQQVLGGTTVTLKAKGSTGGWSQLPGAGTPVTLANPGALETTFTAPTYDAVNVPANQLVFRWTDRGSSPVVEDEVTITVVNYQLVAFPNDTGTAVNLVSTAANDNLALFIQRSDNLGQTWFTLAGTQGRVAGFTDTTVALGATYQYRLVYNNSVVSNVATVLVSEVPVLSSLVVTPGEIRDDGATLAVGINTPNVDVEQGGKAQYRVKLATNADFPVDWVDVSPFKDFIITGLQEDTAYDVTVRAVDVGGRAGPALTASATTLRRGDVTPAVRRKKNRDKWYEASCFVATAVSGSKDAEPVRILCLWRNQDLRGSDTGEQFIAWYYSPEGGSAWACWLNQHPWCKPVARAGLAPIVTYAALRVGEWPPLADTAYTIALALGLGMMVMGYRYRRRLWRLAR